MYFYISKTKYILCKSLKIENKWKQVNQSQYQAERNSAQRKIISSDFKTQSFSYNLVEYILNGGRVERTKKKKERLNCIQQLFFKLYCYLCCCFEAIYIHNKCDRLNNSPQQCLNSIPGTCKCYLT